jgi:putative membrane protein
MNPSRSHALLLAFTLSLSALAAHADPKTLIPDHPAAGVVSDPEFLRRASASSDAESQMNQLAVNLAVDTELRAQAGRLAADHLRNRDQLRALAKSKNVDIPTTTESTYQAAIDSLRNLEGRDFDVAWLKAVRADHEMLVDLFQGVASRASDDDVRKYATDMLPVLQAHLARMQQLEIARR